jgi:hypothetical protein
MSPDERFARLLAVGIHSFRARQGLAGGDFPAHLHFLSAVQSCCNSLVSSSPWRVVSCQVSASRAAAALPVVCPPSSPSPSLQKCTYCTRFSSSKFLLTSSHHSHKKPHQRGISRLAYPQFILAVDALDPHREGFPATARHSGHLQAQSGHEVGHRIERWW